MNYKDYDIISVSELNSLHSLHTVFENCHDVTIHDLKLDGLGGNNMLFLIKNCQSVKFLNVKAGNTRKDIIRISPPLESLEIGDSELYGNRIVNNEHPDAIQMYPENPPITNLRIYNTIFHSSNHQFTQALRTYNATLEGVLTHSGGQFNLDIFNSAKINYCTFASGLTVTAHGDSVIGIDHCVIDWGVFKGKPENYRITNSVICNHGSDTGGINFEEETNTLLPRRTLPDLFDDEFNLLNNTKKAGYNFYQSTEPTIPDVPPVIIPDEPDTITIPRAELESVLEKINRWLEG